MCQISIYTTLFLRRLRSLYALPTLIEPSDCTKKLPMVSLKRHLISAFTSLLTKPTQSSSKKEIPFQTLTFKSLTQQNFLVSTLTKYLQNHYCLLIHQSWYTSEGTNPRNSHPPPENPHLRNQEGKKLSSLA